MSPVQKPVKKTHIYSDVLGIEIGAMRAEGYPAVRMRKRGGKTEIIAIGYLKDLPGELPESWEEASKKRVSWSIKGEMQAPHTALAIVSKQANLILNTRANAPEDRSIASKDGIRTVVRKIMDPDIYFEASLPEYQVLWLSHLFPEGHQPTTCSVQVGASALLNCILNQPKFKAQQGTAFVAIVRAEQTILAAYNQGKLVLYREQLMGHQTVRRALQESLGIEESLIDGMLAEKLIDPMPVIGPLLKPIFRQIGIAKDYLARRLNCSVNQCFLMGVPSAQEAWVQAYEEAKIELPLEVIGCLDGQTLPKSAPKDLKETDFEVAYGAACAVLEDA